MTYRRDTSVASPPRPPWGEVRRFQRLMRGFAWAAAAFLAVATLAAVVAGVGAANEAPLRRNGVTTEARVLDAHRIERGPDRVEVAYATVDGRLQHATLAVADAAEFPPGETTSVVYDPDDPAHVVPAAGGEPLWIWALLVAAVLAVPGLWLAWWSASWRRRVIGVAAQGPGRRAWARHVLVRGRHGVESWAVIWRDDPNRQPAYAMRLTDQAAAPPAPSGPREVWLLGTFTQRALVVVVDGTTVWWPLGRLRRPPRRLRRALADLGSTASADPSPDDPSIELPPPPPFEEGGPSVWLRLALGLRVALAVTLSIAGPSLAWWWGQRTAHAETRCAGPPPGGPVAVAGDGGVPLAATLLDRIALPLNGPVTTELPDAPTVTARYRDDVTAPLEEAGFVRGVARDWVGPGGTEHVGLTVLEFGDPVGAARFEATRWVAFCRFDHRLFDTGYPDARGVTFPRAAGGYQHRIVYQVGERLFHLQHDTPSDDPSTLVRVLGQQRSTAQA